MPPAKLHSLGYTSDHGSRKRKELAQAAMAMYRNGGMPVPVGQLGVAEYYQGLEADLLVLRSIAMTVQGDTWESNTGIFYPPGHR